MTSKDYKKMVEILNTSPTKEEIISKMIKWFKEDNTRFDEKKFREVLK